MRVNLAGKKQDKHRSCKIKPRFSDDESLGSEYCLDLENENEKRYKEKSTLSIVDTNTTNAVSEK